MALVHCTECGREISDKAAACPHCGCPLTKTPAADAKPKAVATEATSSGEVVLAVEHPTMFRNQPFLYSLFMLLIVGGVGLSLYLGVFWPLFLCVAGLASFFVWWVSSQSTEVTITDQRTVLRTGLLNKFTNEIRHADVRNIQIKQSFFQRIMGVGMLSVSSAAQDIVDIEIYGVRDPEGLADLIRVRQDAE